MFTANSMNCLAEAIGLALPGNGTILATSADRKALYERASKRIVAMAREFAKVGPGHGLLAREIGTAAAFDNAMILDMAMGGSTNTVLHILAIAHEAGVPFSLERIDALEPEDAEHLQGEPVEPLSHRGRRAGRRDPHDPRRGRTRLPGTAGPHLPHRHRQDPRREHRGVRRPRRECRLRRPAVREGPSRRRADQPGVDGAQRRRRGPLAGRWPGPPRGRGRDRRGGARSNRSMAAPTARMPAATASTRST